MFEIVKSSGYKGAFARSTLDGSSEDHALASATPRLRLSVVAGRHMCGSMSAMTNGQRAGGALVGRSGSTGYWPASTGVFHGVTPASLPHSRTSSREAIQVAPRAAPPMDLAVFAARRAVR